MTQVFSTDKSEGVRFEHDSISLDTFCSFDFIKSKSKGVFKKLVKQRTRDYALNELKSMQQKHSKMKNLQYEDIQVQDYLTRCDINTEQKKLIFKYRTRMAEFGENYRGGRTQVGGRGEKTVNLLSGVRV